MWKGAHHECMCLMYTDCAVLTPPAGGESQPRSRAGAEASSRSGELLPRSRSDALSDSWLGGGKFCPLLLWRRSDRGSGASKTSVCCIGPSFPGYTACHGGFVQRSTAGASAQRVFTGAWLLPEGQR